MNESSSIGVAAIDAEIMRVLRDTGAVLTASAIAREVRPSVPMSSAARAESLRRLAMAGRISRTSRRVISPAGKVVAVYWATSVPKKGNAS